MQYIIIVLTCAGYRDIAKFVVPRSVPREQHLVLDKEMASVALHASDEPGAIPVEKEAETSVLRVHSRTVWTRLVCELVNTGASSVIRVFHQQFRAKEV